MPINMLMFEVKTAEREYLEKHLFEDYKIELYEECLDSEFMNMLSSEILENTNAISIFNNSSISSDVLDNFRNLRVISIRAAHYDNICISSCEDKNIAVVNIPDFGAQSVAEYTIGLMINLVRNIIPANNFIKSNNKYKGGFLGRDLKDMTLGIAGTDLTGATVCKIAKALGMNIIAYDNIKKQELIETYNIEYLPIDEFAEKSDIISVHLEYTPETYHLFNDEIFSKCKDGMYFTNTSKSELVDIVALQKYIDNGKIAGAALDTSPCDSICYNCVNLSEKLEPSNLDCLTQAEFIERFMAYDNVIITPCIAYATQDAIENNMKQTMINVKKALNGDKMCRIV